MSESTDKTLSMQAGLLQACCEYESSRQVVGVVVVLQVCTANFVVLVIGGRRVQGRIRDFIDIFGLQLIYRARVLILIDTWHGNTILEISNRFSVKDVLYGWLSRSCN